MPETNFVSIEELKFDEKGLIPAVVVDSESKKVLTVAYMNAEHANRCNSNKGDFQWKPILCPSRN